MSRYDVRAAREAVRRSLGRVHPLTVSGDLGELQGQLPVVFPRHLLAVYRLAHLAALQGLVLADRRVLDRGRLSRRQRLTAAHPQVRGDRRYPPLGRITEPARIAAAVYDEVLWQFPHRAGRLAYAEALACPEGLVQQARDYGRDPFTSRVGGDGECPEDLYPGGVAARVAGGTGLDPLPGADAVGRRRGRLRARLLRGTRERGVSPAARAGAGFPLRRPPLRRPARGGLGRARLAGPAARVSRPGEPPGSA